jgi:hypothetical protein
MAVKGTKPLPELTVTYLCKNKREWMKRVGRSGEHIVLVRVVGRRRGAVIQAKIVTAGVDKLLLH